MLIIQIPKTYVPERVYIFQLLFQEFLGIDIKLVFLEREDILIIDSDDLECKRLRIADVFFRLPKDKWLTCESLPQRPSDKWNIASSSEDISLVSSTLPVIYGRPVVDFGTSGQYLNRRQNEIYLGLDIFGSAFFMLTRYEELVKGDRDEHGRFPATASLAYQEGFLDRPIINEYIEILWWCLKTLWPGLERKKREFRTILSHDVDVPFAQAFSGVPQLIRNCGGDIFKRKSPNRAFMRLKSWQAVKRGAYKRDLNYTFERLMDISEQNNLQSAFFFKTACTNASYDNAYSIEHPYLKKLLRDVNNRGHEIGLHPSYETYQNGEQIKAEFNSLLQVCEELGIRQSNWGGRQHYLRWQVPITWRYWAEAGLNYDSTLSYTDCAGFRCGICYEYPVFDLEQRQTLSLMERPLVVMEGSVIGDRYMNLTGEAALNHMLMLKKHCRLFNGDFTLLWHNSSFDTPELWKMYKLVVSTDLGVS